MTAQERITEWAALADNATEGPWVWDEPSGDKWPSGEATLRNGAGETVLSSSSWGYDADGIEASSKDRALTAASRTAVPAMAAALTAVLERHHPIEVEPSDTICSDCSFRLPNGRFFGKLVEWPCPTVAAIETALGVTA